MKITRKHLRKLIIEELSRYTENKQSLFEAAARSDDDDWQEEQEHAADYRDRLEGSEEDIEDGEYVIELCDIPISELSEMTPAEIATKIKCEIRKFDVDERAVVRAFEIVAAKFQDLVSDISVGAKYGAYDEWLQSGGSRNVSRDQFWHVHRTIPRRLLKYFLIGGPALVDDYPGGLEVSDFLTGYENVSSEDVRSFYNDIGIIPASFLHDPKSGTGAWISEIYIRSLIRYLVENEMWHGIPNPLSERGALSKKEGGLVGAAWGSAYGGGRRGANAISHIEVLASKTPPGKYGLELRDDWPPSGI